LLRRIVAYGLVVVIVVLLLAGILFLLVTSDPPGHTRPADFTPQELQQHAAEFLTASGKVANALADKSNQTPFDVTFTDAMINSYVRTQPKAALARLPSWLANPQVVFEEGQIVVMADTRYGQTESVVSLCLEPSITEGGELGLHLAALKAGRVPMPDALRQKFLDMAGRRLEELRRRPAPAETPGAAPPEGDLAKLADNEAEAVAAAMETFRSLLADGQATLDLRRQHVKLEGLELLPHRLHLVGRRVDKPKTK